MNSQSYFMHLTMTTHEWEMNNEHLRQVISWIYLDCVKLNFAAFQNTKGQDIPWLCWQSLCADQSKNLHLCMCVAPTIKYELVYWCSTQASAYTSFVWTTQSSSRHCCTHVETAPLIGLAKRSCLFSDSAQYHHCAHMLTTQRLYLLSCPEWTMMQRG